jgi:hypothetical protein
MNNGGSLNAWMSNPSPWDNKTVVEYFDATADGPSQNKYDRLRLIYMYDLAVRFLKCYQVLRFIYMYDLAVHFWNVIGSSGSTYQNSAFFEIGPIMVYLDVRFGCAFLRFYTSVFSTSFKLNQLSFVYMYDLAVRFLKCYWSLRFIYMYDFAVQFWNVIGSSGSTYQNSAFFWNWTN